MPRRKHMNTSLKAEPAKHKHTHTHTQDTSLRLKNEMRHTTEFSKVVILKMFKCPPKRTEVHVLTVEPLPINNDSFLYN